MNPFFRRREVWLPTFAGWLLLIGAAVAVVVGASLGITGFLSVHEAARGADGRGARTLVVEGWIDAADLAQAAARYRAGAYERLLTTGGPIEGWSAGGAGFTYAERAAAYLRASSGGAIAAVAVPAPASAQDRTFLSAVMVREWAEHAGIALGAVDVFTAGVHTRRSRLLYRMALGPAVEVGALAAVPHGLAARPWWQSSAGAKGVIGEALSLAWTACCFWPAAPGTHEERWAVPARAP